MPSSRAHKMAKGQYSTGGAVGRALRTMRRHYADGGDVVKERAMFLPLGTYGDGTTRAAWPGLLYEPAAAWKRMMDSGYRPGDAENTRKMAEDSFTVAGAVPIAGLAAGAVRPGASLGSGGGRLRAYHGTSEPIQKFDPAIRGETTGADSARNAFWFASDPDLASDYAVLAGNGPLATVERQLKQFEAKALQGEILTPDEAAQARKLYAEREAIEARLKDGEGVMEGANVIPVDLDFKRPLVKDYAGQPYRDESYSSLVRQALEAGNDGVVLRNTYDPAFPLDGRRQVDVYGAIRPGTVYNAMTGDLMYANPSTASVLSLLQDRKDRR